MVKHKKRSDGKYFEAKTAGVVRHVDSSSKVKEDVQLKGKLSKIDRQVDVLVEPRDYDHLILECKDHAKPIDIDDFSVFVAMLEDVDARRGAMVSNSPYTESVRNFAKSRRIDLLHLVDTGDPRIRTKIQASALLRDSKMKTFQFGFSTIANFSEGIPYSPIIIGPQYQGTARQYLTYLWNNTDIPDDTGTHEFVITNGFVLSVNGNKIPMDKITLTYEAEVECYTGLVDVINTVGIFNVLDSSYRCKSMETAKVEPYEVEKVWERVTEEEASKLRTTLGMVVRSVY